MLSAIACDAVKLDELNLSHCSLPANCLPYLAKIVQASADTLQRLDLQGNGWDIKTPMALLDWEEFLNSFKDCVNLRKVNFSDNRLGDKGIETLVRVYVRQLQNLHLEDNFNQDIADEPLSRSISGLSLTGSDDEEDDDDELSSTMGTSTDFEFPQPSPLAASLPITSSRRRCDNSKVIPNSGLPSVAYILVENVGMTDLSALHLTYLLPYHHLPHVLLGRLDAHIADTIAGRDEELYDKGNFCRGILYYSASNNEFSPLAQRILEGVEKVRRAGGLMSELLRAVSPLMGNVGPLPPSPDSFRSRRDSDSSRGYFPDTPSPSRKDSISSIRTTPSVHSRAGSLFMSPSHKTDVNAQWADVVKTRPKLQGEILKSAKTVHISQLWAASVKLLSLARIFTLPPSQKTAVGAIGASRENRRWNVPRPIQIPPSPVSPSTPKAPRMTRSQCIGSLDEKIWMKILLPIADPEGILSEVQAMDVIKWACDRNTLAREGEWAGKLAHVQIWKLLDVLLIFDLMLTLRHWSVLAMRFDRYCISYCGLKVAYGLKVSIFFL